MSSSSAASTEDFAPIAASLAREVRRYHFDRGSKASASAREATVATNSTLVPSRAEHLIALLQRRGIQDLRGLGMLDVGAGFGALSAYFASRGATVVALDPNPGTLAAAAAVSDQHGLNVRTIVGRMEDGVEAAPFDVVLVNNSLCYVVDPEGRRRALRALHDAAGPGGVLILRDLNARHPLDHFTRLPGVHWLPPRAGRAFAGALGRQRPLVRPAWPGALRRGLHAAGWDEVRLEPGTGWGRGAGRLVARGLYLSAVRR